MNHINVTFIWLILANNARKTRAYHINQYLSKTFDKNKRATRTILQRFLIMFSQIEQTFEIFRKSNSLLVTTTIVFGKTFEKFKGVIELKMSNIK